MRRDDCGVVGFNFGMRLLGITICTAFFTRDLCGSGQSFRFLKFRQ